MVCAISCRYVPLCAIMCHKRIGSNLELSIDSIHNSRFDPSPLFKKQQLPLDVPASAIGIRPDKLKIFKKRCSKRQLFVRPDPVLEPYFAFSVNVHVAVETVQPV